ncbi:glycosyltransferase family 4 protein [Calothrix sp. FACHB-1219]|uniref:glycosyltransferase family 4 protein n=1 Tax=unclassified Calothrix TaxID=2619626 RepID=UPI001687E436|nr:MULTISPECIES: glycosyltransferase family 4 protein [unclassified Calothrix]MBD2206360.1 glycosyltransferase family 4 protein [Calothrix sp. FACHB-168]MBD2219473.1 glycosyltransferase family 4 protein [Calothrix sp. FACHB-1219]
MKVGYLAENYLYKRNITNIVKDVEYQKVNNLFALTYPAVKYINKIAKKTVIPFNDSIYQFTDLDFYKVDILHFFNTISYGKTPWITTFETILPRLDCSLFCHQGARPDFSVLTNYKAVKKALAAMASDSCKRLIAMSDCNANMQRILLKDFPQYQQAIEPKITTLHPPQQLLVSSYADKKINLDGKIKFILVGASFFRKGGMEVVETFSKLKREYNYDLELILISSLRLDDYATKETEADIQKAKILIQQNLDWIKYYEQLPNKEVLELTKQCHVGLLPTYADTYGFSVLEFQAAGCPVITTNIRALPEVNDNDRGWIIEVPTNYLGEAIYTTKEERLEINSAIKSGLERIVHEIFANREAVIAKSNRSIQGIRDNHSLSNYADKMKDIYLQVVPEG